jgi:hypothetical protein
VIEIALGFVIALSVGLTGLGGGSFTTPLLVLFLGLPAAAAVGTALAFSAVLRLLAAPFHLLGHNVRARCFWPLVLGGLPGLTLGIYFLRGMRGADWSPKLLIALGVLLVGTACASLFGPRHSLDSTPRPQAREKRKSHAWLALLALPIGMETGFSSAGSGALGVLALLNFSDLTAAEAVGTDLVFGSVLAVAGAGWSAGLGLTATHLLTRLLMGGVPGVLIGCMLGKRLPARRLRALVMGAVLVLGLGLVWSGIHSFGAPPVARRTAPAGGFAATIR